MNWERGTLGAQAWLLGFAIGTHRKCVSGIVVKRVRNALELERPLGDRRRGRRSEPYSDGKCGRCRYTRSGALLIDGQEPYHLDILKRKRPFSSNRHKRP